MYAVAPSSASDAVPLPLALHHAGSAVPGTCMSPASLVLVPRWFACFAHQVESRLNMLVMLNTYTWLHMLYLQNPSLVQSTVKGTVLYLQARRIGYLAMLRQICCWVTTTVLIVAVMMPPIAIATISTAVVAQLHVTCTSTVEHHHKSLGHRSIEQRFGHRQA